MAVASGTDTLIATPHRGWFLHQPCRPEIVRAHVAVLQESIKRAGIPLTVLPGDEIKLSGRVATDLLDGEVGTLGDAGKWALIEPPFDGIPPDGLSSLRKIIKAGFQVVLAHPERCASIQQSLAFLDLCADLGMAFQITSGSLLGTFGLKAKATAEAMLAHAADWPLVIASDTHDTHDRPPNLLAAARDAAALIAGAHEAQKMVDTRPRSFITSVPSAG